ncbi:DUF421 domain-containing protein [Constantimarinum furrinae]|uniref:Membrane protein n=1 Tax=Constantimarinum furrinae TaxID=2562285 RepID=A0A7G8PWW0_9FLAO|nr:YetF domain-containing protein [Constantimarinum furrinae]QNJ98826.1 membrane protein [Constantimarinum furrinae]
MKEWFSASGTSLIAVILTGIGIYIAVILLTRIFGKRSFSKMSSFDFAMTVAIGSIIATTLLSKSVSLLHGIIGLLTVYVLQLLAAYLRKWNIFRRIIDNEPLLLMDGTEILEDNLKKARVTKGDLRSKLREANVIELKEVKAVIFETTGDIVVLHDDNPNKQIDAWLMEGVNRT